MNPACYAAALELLDKEIEPAERAVALLELGSAGRSAFRAVVAALEVRPDPETLGALGRRAGCDPGEVPLSRLVRRAYGRETEARRRSNPLARNEGFVCEHCGSDVRPADAGIQRNHCPDCLCSLHVDVVPGDREASCGGLMRPVAIERIRGDQVVILHRCVRCGVLRRNRAALACREQPDSARAIAALSAVEEA